MTGVYLDGLYVAGLLLVSQELPLQTTEEAYEDQEEEEGPRQGQQKRFVLLF